MQKDKGVVVTEQMILDANPGLNVNRLKAGQRVFVPGVPAAFSGIGAEHVVQAPEPAPPTPSEGESVSGSDQSGNQGSP